jgi:UDP-2,3-diacylglucosamine pyrophosphatase LpxH
MSKTIVFSDLHFGYEGFNKTQFDQFLRYLQNESAPSKLLILGDIFDLWRADPIDSLSCAWHYTEALKNLGAETHYVIGNHDYHNWVSCLKLDQRDSFQWMKVSYPFAIIDNTFVVHGDYLDIYEIGKAVPKEAIYGVYEAIYHGDKATVRTLERYFYDPVMLLIKWIELYKKKPEIAKSQPIARELSTFMNLDSKQEIRKLERGSQYLMANRATAANLLIPASSRPILGAELRTHRQKLAGRAKQGKSWQTLADSKLPVRSLITRKSPFELAVEISGNTELSKVFFGHTHVPVNKSTEHWWNSGCWVDNESTFIEMENGNVHLYRFMDGHAEEIPETSH